MLWVSVGCLNFNFFSCYSCFFDRHGAKFSPLAAAATFLDPTVAADALLDSEDPEIQELVTQVETYISHTLSPPAIREEADDDDDDADAQQATTSHGKRPRFRFLSKASSRPKPSKPSVQDDIRKYKEQLSESIIEESAFHFWDAQGPTSYQTLKPIALDLLAMPASQAFVERVFSITGDLSRGKRNRAKDILERSAFLKLSRDR